MDQTDLPEDSAPPHQGPQTDEGVAPWAAFIDHLRYGHGIRNVPKDLVS